MLDPAPPRALPLDLDASHATVTPPDPNPAVDPTLPPTESDPRYLALVRRDPEQDGRFVYGVVTTGVYCRPSCPSPRPRAGNVRLHDDPASAERAGFRPCRRCHPDRAPAEHPDTERVVRACRRLEGPDAPPGLEDLARELDLAPDTLRRLFRRATGLTPREYAEALRDERLRRALPDAASVTDAALQSGFGSLSRFYARAPEVLGMRPDVARRGAPEETLRVALGTCDLGHVLVAASDHGICDVRLGDDPLALLAGLEARFPAARFEVGDEAFEGWVARVVGLVQGPPGHPGRVPSEDLPLDVRGTAFQRRVWDALREIPHGARWTYSELAAHLGVPRAVRAVARACGANGVAVLIPCHRVVRRDGGLGGYRWGVERKRVLLEREATGEEDGPRSRPPIP